MNNSSTILAQILNFIPEYELRKLVLKYGTDRYSKTFRTKDLLTSLIFAQSIEAESLREITDSFSALKNYYYHLGLPASGVKRSTLADCNSRVDYRVFQELFYVMVDKYQSTIFGNRSLGIDEDVYALDASFIEVVMSLVDWNRFRADKGAIKLHTVYSVTKQIPVLINITPGKIHDLSGMPALDKRFTNSIITFDKGYWRAYWFKQLDERKINFVTRIKKNVNYEVTGQHKLTTEDMRQGVLKDEEIVFTSTELKEDYPQTLRLVTYYDEENDKQYRFITNLTDSKKHSAKKIADIYRYRWQIELFFKWIKQNLKVKTFYGTTKNAVFNQIWVALIYYLIVSHIQSQASYPYSKLELTRVINLSLLQRIPLINLMRADFESAKKYFRVSEDQLNLFDSS